MSYKKTNRFIFLLTMNNFLVIFQSFLINLYNENQTLFYQSNELQKDK